VLGGRVIALSGSRVLVLNGSDGALLDALDLDAADDVPTAAAADPLRRALWLGTGRGAILRFRLE
ncbi:MAG: hypothetical protein ACAI25_11095, partial [Planctomycetota bacterium]